jgi:hypothetical protein
MNLTKEEEADMLHSGNMGMILINNLDSLRTSYKHIDAYDMHKAITDLMDEVEDYFSMIRG